MKQYCTPLRLLAAAVLLGLFAGCSETPPVKPQEPAPDAAYTDQLARASARELAGDYTAAAVLYEQLADGHPDSPSYAQLLVRAADARLRAGDQKAAAALLDRLQGAALSPAVALRARLVRAGILLARNRSGEALELLTPEPAADAPTDLRRRYLRALAEAYRMSGNLLDSARVLGDLDPLLPDPQRRLDNQVQLLRTLMVLTETSLELLRPDRPGPLGGWMDLARLFKDPDAQTLEQRLALWRETHPGHPALPELLRQGGAKLQLETRSYGQVAVLLPTGGHYATVARALRDGLLASYYALPPARRPRLRWYDSSDALAVWPLLQQAVADGAEAVVGPLQKEAVQQLARAGTLPVPVLALNRVTLETAPPANLYQFGLSPEDEADQVARRMWQDGAVTALALVPAGDWGARILASFRNRWEALGGTLLEHQDYDPAANDFSKPIQQLLDLDDSGARRRALERTLGGKVEFEPHRRQDAGALFLAANADKVRQLWPQLQFNHLADLPVYTTSHAYPGSFSKPRDLDLVGLTLPDMPWLLQPQLRGAVTPDSLPPELASGALTRLFALGMDSLRLLSALPRLEEFPSASLDGATGNLSLDSLHRVGRRLMWARITSEGPELSGFSPVLPEETEPQPVPPTTAVTPAPAPPAPAVPADAARP